MEIKHGIYIYEIYEPDSTLTPIIHDIHHWLIWCLLSIPKLTESANRMKTKTQIQGRINLIKSRLSPFNLNFQFLFIHFLPMTKTICCSIQLCIYAELFTFKPKGMRFDCQKVAQCAKIKVRNQKGPLSKSVWIIHPYTNFIGEHNVYKVICINGFES